MPSSRSSATSVPGRTRRWRRAGAFRRGCPRRRRRVLAGPEFEVARHLQHEGRDLSIRGLQRGLPGQPGRVGGEPELREPARGGHDLTGVDVIGQHLQPGASGAGQYRRERAVFGHGGQRLAVRGQRRRITG